MAREIAKALDTHKNIGVFIAIEKYVNQNSREEPSTMSFDAHEIFCCLSPGSL